MGDIASADKLRTIKDISMKKKILMIILMGSVIAGFSTPEIVEIYNKNPHEYPNLVLLDNNGNITYIPYANHGEKEKINIIPDFSFAGYKMGGISLPIVDTEIILNPIEGNNTEQIQNAINQISTMPLNPDGIRGAVLLKKGTYELDGQILINNSGIILRGEGQGIDGTILKANARFQHDFIEIKGEGDALVEMDDTQRNITSLYVPTGSHVIEVEDASIFSPGDEILVVRTPNDFWIDTLEMAQWGWTASSYKISHERKIKSINNNKLTINIPIVDPIQKKYGGGYVCKSNTIGRISNCGIENLRLISNFTHEDDEEHAWKAIVLSRTINSWVKQVTAQYFGYACVSIEDESNFNTVQDCAMLDPKSITTGSRKYSFNINDGLGNLFQRCFTRGGRHDFVTGSRVTGPNVWLDCLAIEFHADIGPHHRWATGTLFDNIKGGEIRVRNRRSAGTGHGWAGAQTMFWHNYAPNDLITVSSPLGAINWGFGCSSKERDGEYGYWSQWKKEIEPRSLYLQQLKDRMGALAVQNIATAEQLRGIIWNDLEQWSGEGKPSWL